MHEYSIVQALLERVETEASSIDARAVSRLHVRIGELAGVEVPLLVTAFDAFKARSIAEHADLVVETVPAVWLCSGCGRAFTRGQILRIDIAREVCGNAAATIAIGTCAAYGGLPAAAPNPTAALSVADAVPGLRNLINLPACPANAENLTALLVYYLTFERWPPLDRYRRPLFAYDSEFIGEHSYHPQLCVIQVATTKRIALVDRSLYFLQHDMRDRLPIEVRVDPNTHVGPDRLVNTVAAFERYGGELIVVDFGTATTFDAISGEGEYLGGVICPGVGISADALFQRAARLPRPRAAHGAERALDLLLPRLPALSRPVHSGAPGLSRRRRALNSATQARARRLSQTGASRK